MRSFFKILFASLIACVLALVIVFFLFTASITAFVGKFGEKQETEVTENSVLRLNLNYKISDRTEEFPGSTFDFLAMEFDKKLGLNDILKLIDRAKRDDRIKGIMLEMDFEGPDLATTEEIRDALEEFKSSGKFIISYGEMVGQKMYYLASVSDKIYVNPSGLFEFKGFYAQTLFFTGALEKLGIDLQIVYDGKYKSATEPFRLKEMSEENREQMTALLNSIYSHFLNNISAARNISPEMLDSIASNLLVTNPRLAVQYGLIDGMKYEDEIHDEVRSLLGLPEENAEDNEDDEDEEDLNVLSLKKYADADFSNLKDEPKTDLKNRIAVVYAEGNIVDGKGETGEVGSETFAKAIRKLRKDDRVKAIVLRVNSPGGSALASDVIWRELLVAREDKPVIVSMGNLAASGGYFIAAPGNVIYAQPNTITGSIGVFSMFPNMEELFNEKLGITSDVVKTGKHSDIFNPFRPMSEEERAIVKEEVHRIYEEFVERVSSGRNMDTARVHQIAQGRVYTGLEALELGLVDKLGGLEDAIADAAERAGVEEYYVTAYPKREGIFDKLAKMLGEDVETRLMRAQFGEYYQTYEQVQALLSGNRIQARMPYDIIIK